MHDLIKQIEEGRHVLRARAGRTHRATSVGKPDKWRKPYIDFCAATEAGNGSASFLTFDD